MVGGFEIVGLMIGSMPSALPFQVLFQVPVQVLLFSSSSHHR